MERDKGQLYGTRDEHLAACKYRAREYADQGDLQNAVASMMSDLRKHDGWANDTMLGALMLAVLNDARNGNAPAVRRWIDGFN